MAPSLRTNPDPLLRDHDPDVHPEPSRLLTHSWATIDPATRSPRPEPGPLAEYNTPSRGTGGAPLSAVSRGATGPATAICRGALPARRQSCGHGSRSSSVSVSSGCCSSSERTCRRRRRKRRQRSTTSAGGRSRKRIERGRRAGMPGRDRGAEGQAAKHLRDAADCLDVTRGNLLAVLGSPGREQAIVNGVARRAGWRSSSTRACHGKPERRWSRRLRGST